MRFKLIILFFLTLLTANVNAQNKHGDFDLDNYRQTINYTDHYVTFYAHKTSAEPQFTNPGKIYYWYNANQLKTTQGGFSGKLLHGLYTDFYLSKNLKEQGNFNMGLKTGKWNRWDEDGTLIETVNYRSGRLNGKFSRYDAAGNLKESGTYKDGKLNGSVKKYISADSTQVIKYKSGTLLQADTTKTNKQGLFKKKIRQE